MSNIVPKKAEVNFTANFLRDLRSSIAIDGIKVNLPGETIERFISLDKIAEDVYVFEISLFSPNNFINPSNALNLVNDYNFIFSYRKSLNGKDLWLPAFTLNANNIQLVIYARNLIYLDFRNIGVKAKFRSIPYEIQDFIPVYQHYHELDRISFSTIVTPSQEKYKIIQENIGTNTNTFNSLTLTNLIKNNSSYNNQLIKKGDFIKNQEIFILEDNIYKTQQKIDDWSGTKENTMMTKEITVIEQNANKDVLQNATQEIYPFESGKNVIRSFGVEYDNNKDFFKTYPEDMFLLLMN